jgi:hypothetical protein
MQQVKFGSILLMAVLVVSLLTTASVWAEEKPEYGGILKVAIAGDPPSLDMHQKAHLRY